MHIHVYTNAHTRVHKCTYTCTQMHIHVYTNAHTRVHKYTYTCTQMHMFLMYQQLGDTKPFFKLTVVISFMADSQMVTFLSIYSSNIYICKVAKFASFSKPTYIPRYSWWVAWQGQFLKIDFMPGEFHGWRKNLFARACLIWAQVLL